LHLVGFLQPRITMHGTTNIHFISRCCRLRFCMYLSSLLTVLHAYPTQTPSFLFPVAQQPKLGPGRLIVEVSKSHTHTHTTHTPHHTHTTSHTHTPHTHTHTHTTRTTHTPHKHYTHTSHTHHTHTPHHTHTHTPHHTHITHTHTTPHTHNHTQPVRHLWTSDQPVAQTSTYTTHKKHKRRPSTPSAWFELAIPATKRPQTYALYRKATEISFLLHYFALTTENRPTCIWAQYGAGSGVFL